ncbi:hypothetical protein [Cytobacillus kochii]|uniref:hypothetical protein n=1 Tax=Cytobacillus kochii TaxID=859143 RepID=UPI00203B729F|nr:hypothetical protein [Cytobacillus kochii]MCM3321977.1 hypothetical protein [Cytobacillus kochii]MCM3343191.1 hypothetical protein [Cytobacillus kochii]
MSRKKFMIIPAVIVALNISAFSNISAEELTTEDILTTEYTNKVDGSTTKKELIKVLNDIEENPKVDEISDNSKIELVEDVFSNVDEDTVSEYQQDKLDEVSDILNHEVNIGEEYYKEEFVLSDGSSVELSSVDISEDEDEPSLIQPRSVSFGPYRNETKKYGDRRYTATVKLKSVGVTVATLNLGNHYSVGTYGLKMRYCSIGGTNGTVVSAVDASCNVTDSKAEKVGYDMNATGTYKITGYLNNGYVDLHSTIKLHSWNKTKKSVYVHQKYKYVD